MEGSAVRTYRLRQEALAAEQARASKTIIPILVGVIVGVMLISTFLSVRSQTDDRSMWIVLGLSGCFVAYIAISIPLKNRRQLKKCWETYELEVGGDYFLRRQHGVNDLRIPFNQISKVERIPGRYVLITGDRSDRRIGIPEAIEQFPQVLAAVSAVALPSEQKTELWQKQIAVLAGGLMVFMTALWSTSRTVVVPANLICIGLLVWGFIRLSRNPNVQNKTRKLRWWYLFLILVCAMKLLSVLGPVAHN